MKYWTVSTHRSNYTVSYLVFALLWLLFFHLFLPILECLELYCLYTSGDVKGLLAFDCI